MTYGITLNLGERTCWSSAQPTDMKILGWVAWRSAWKRAQGAFQARLYLS